MTLGDRVAVMLDGRLQQVAPPQALYESPVNEFVAGFIGSPSINLVEADLARSERRALRELRRAPSGRRRRRRPRASPISRTTSAARSCSAFGPSTSKTRRSSQTRRPTGAFARPASSPSPSEPRCSSTSRCPRPVIVDRHGRRRRSHARLQLRRARRTEQPGSLRAWTRAARSRSRARSSSRSTRAASTSSTRSRGRRSSP